MKLKSLKKPIQHKNKFILFIVFLCITIIVILSFFISNIVKNRDLTKSTIIAEKLSKISELSTIKYSYSKIISLSNSKKLNSFEIPFTEKSFLIKYSGYVKAGVDLKDIHVVVHNKNITITLNKSKILDHVVNDQDLSVLDEKSSLFNKLSMQDMIDEMSNEKKKIEVDLLNTSFLDGANTNAKLLLLDILSDMEFENVKIIFK
ncbi:DUF4230 domain-containing protein [Clostridium lacusfryxellense]|uniref:DUF4230 domain-containing protein n=1 Tax=Clostridium lacusfryxellense TaxID=205328 RepID=UPI001C0D519F|nr:DUF4230 domain-containing protein [Clostridium lacusfryxellense]MBU3112954.1 DUF4230 domain-containing protein [Clostridium lacusfryxellense]